MERLELLRQANDTLVSFLAAHGSDCVLGTDEEIAQLREVRLVLGSAGSALPDLLHCGLAPDAQTELMLYRENLVRLRAQLVALQAAALHSRTVLQRKTERLCNIQAWSTTSRELG